jgi:hypothetical protein
LIVPGVVLEGSMTAIIPFIRNNVFDAETTKAMGEAFDVACVEIGNGGQPALVKEVIAKRIIEAAKKGERDPQRLCAKALDALGLNRRFS